MIPAAQEPHSHVAGQSERAELAVLAAGRVLLAAMLLLTLALAFLRQIDLVELAFFWVAAIALYLIVSRVHPSSKS